MTLGHRIFGFCARPKSVSVFVNDRLSASISTLHALLLNASLHIQQCYKCIPPSDSQYYSNLVRDIMDSDKEKEKGAPRSQASSESDDDGPTKKDLQQSQTQPQPQTAQNNLTLDKGEEYLRYRRHFYQIWCVSCSHRWHVVFSTKKWT